VDSCTSRQSTRIVLSSTDQAQLGAELALSGGRDV
jgi:hypothetical protein